MHRLSYIRRFWEICLYDAMKKIMAELKGKADGQTVKSVIDAL